jgi:F-type H+-transporting ATPase subunit b
MNLLFIRTITLVPIANAAGGLFDFNGTLPLLVIQFTLLSIVLTFLFYKPLSKTLEERETAISYNLRYSSSYLLKASINSILYHEFIAIENKQAQRLISESKKDMREFVDAQVDKERVSQNLLLEKARSDGSIEIPKILQEYEYTNLVKELSGLTFSKVLDLKNNLRDLELIYLTSYNGGIRGFVRMTRMTPKNPQKGHSFKNEG